MFGCNVLSSGLPMSDDISAAGGRSSEGLCISGSTDGLGGSIEGLGGSIDGLGGSIDARGSKDARRSIAARGASIIDGSCIIEGCSTAERSDAKITKIAHIHATHVFI